MDTDEKTCISHTLDNFMETQEKENNRKCFLPCISKMKQLTTFVVSADGLPGREACMLQEKFPVAYQPSGNSHPHQYKIMSTLR